MAIEIDLVILGENHLEVLFKGASDGRSYVRLLPVIFTIAQFHRARRVLMDCSRTVYPKTHVLWEHQAAEFLARMQPLEVEVAVISSTSGDEHNLAHYETAARNRGARLQVFHERTEGIKWLAN